MGLDRSAKLTQGRATMKQRPKIRGQKSEVRSRKEVYLPMAGSCVNVYLHLAKTRRNDPRNHTSNTKRSTKSHETTRSDPRNHTSNMNNLVPFRVTNRQNFVFLRTCDFVDRFLCHSKYNSNLPVAGLYVTSVY